MSRNDHELNPQETSVLTVCTGEEFTERLRQAFECRSWPVQVSEYEAYISAERRPALGALRAAPGCIAFVDFDKDAAHAAQTVHYLTHLLAGRITVVAVAGRLDPTLVINAMRAGCGEFLQRNTTLTGLLETLDRLEKTEAALSPSAIANGSILSFFGAKGGVGTTTLAVHLAYALVKTHGKRVLLIDHHAELGHVCVYLGLDGSRFHFHEVVRNVNRLDSELLHGFVARHASGLDVLSSPDTCGGAKHLEPEAIARTLAFLRSEYDYVILDCDVPSAEINQPVIHASTLIYLVATPDVGAVRDLSRYVDTLVPIDDSHDKLHVVINRAATPYAIDVVHIERAMKLPVSLRIPSSYPELVRADNLGEPLPPGSKSEITQQFARWATSLAGPSTQAANVKKASKSVFSKLQLAKA